MKKTILALTIASSVVLLTGCNEEDDAVKYTGSEIKTEDTANDYASKVKVINELVINNVINHCIDSSHDIKNETCELHSDLKIGSFHIDGKVKLSKDNNEVITIKTLKGKYVTLKNGSKNDFTATYTDASNNDHKITLKPVKSSSEEYTVAFSGQYADNHSEQFQSNSTSDFTYTTQTHSFIDNKGIATLKGRKHTPTWTWKIVSSAVDSTKD